MKHAWWPRLAAGTCICVNSDSWGHRYWAGPIVGANAILVADSIHAQDFGGKLWPSIMSNWSSEYAYRWRGQLGLQTQWWEKGRLLTTCQFRSWAHDRHEPASWVSLHSDARPLDWKTDKSSSSFLFILNEAHLNLTLSLHSCWWNHCQPLLLLSCLTSELKFYLWALML